MATPKLILIIDDIVERLSVIDGTDPYHTTIGGRVKRGQTQLNESEVPFSSVIIGTQQSTETQLQRQITAGVITIHARDWYDDIDGASERRAVQLLADIQTAIETGDRTINGLLLESFQWVSDQIFYPDPPQRIVAVESQYSIARMRYWGNPN